MAILVDLPSERAVLGGIIQHQGDAFFDVCDILNESAFTDKTNAIIYKCLKTILEREQRIDIPSVESVARELNLDHILSKREEVAHIDALFRTKIELPNVRKFAGKIRKLQIARLYRDQLKIAQDKLLEVTGNETINAILGIGETAILDFSSLVNDVDQNPKNIGEDIQEHVDFLIANPVESMGLSSGFPIWDASIGGGLRKRTVSVVAARPKIGKSTFGTNIELKVGLDGFPVLVFDNEMAEDDHKNRMLASLSGVAIDEIERGKFADSYKENKVRDAALKLSKIKVYFKSIGGIPFEDQLSIARRWLLKEVGLNADGTAKDCLMIYDQLQLLDSNDLSRGIAEHQALGFIFLGLHNFVVRYAVPMLAFIQLNRDGIDVETTGAVSQSDRIIWRCSNLSIFKKKSDEEKAQDGQENGNRKLVPLVARHGPGLSPGEYINMNMKGYCSQIGEGKTNFTLRKENKNKPPQPQAEENAQEDVEENGPEPTNF